MAECRDEIYSNDYFDNVIDFIPDIEAYVEQQRVVCYQTIREGIYVLHRQRAASMEISIDLYGYRRIPKLYGLMDTSALESTGVLKIRRQSFLDLLGQDIVIGLIDTGIDYLNPLFINQDGTSRIGAIWDQSIRDGVPPDGIQYGSLYTTEDINAAIQSSEPLSVVPSQDTDGHGTYLAGIMAGNEDIANDFSGVAPLAQLAVVKLKDSKPYLREYFGIPDGVIAYQENDIMQAVRFLVDYANQTNKPLSICIGLGTTSGNHDGDSPLSRYLDFIATYSRVCISCAAGNEANVGNHNSGTVEEGQSTDVELKVGKNETTFVTELWARAPGNFSVSVISPSGEVAGKIPAKLNVSSVIRYVLEPTVISVDYRSIELGSGDELIVLRFVNPVEGVWRIRIFNDGDLTKNYNMWLPINGFISADTYFLQPDPFITLVETGTTRRPIAAGTYNHTSNTLYLNSSRGYTVSNLVKPDIVAPGVNVYGPIGRNQFGTKTGSSIAAAFTAGLAALLLQWGIGYGNSTTINTSDIKTILIRGANRNQTITYPNREWGYGSVDLFSSFESLRTTGN
ncbi:Ser-type protease [Lachnospiraceae bacterium KM106-2]|nr:Ser-type protease [Lachnospiraceae bacterium KM106-2]